jgi:hypothetical protein
MKCWMVVIAASAVLLAGCSSYRLIPRSDLHPDSKYSGVRVATFEGFEYNFSRIAVRPDTLDGFYMETEEKTGGKDEVWYEDVEHVHRIPLSRVARVEIVRRDPVKTAFYGASVAAAGYFLANLVNNTSSKPRSSGGDIIKPPPGGGGGP